MTDVEKKVLSISAELWNQYRTLPEFNADDTNDFRYHIHAIQRIIMAREPIRSLELEIKPGCQ